MSRASGSETLEGISGGAQQNQQVQVSIDDANAPVLYSANARVWGSPEEIHIDFAGPLRPTSAKSATLKIEQRVTLNPFAAKRLAMLLSQWVQQYEATYGYIELDERKRRVPQAASHPAPIITPQA